MTDNLKPENMALVQHVLGYSTARTYNRHEIDRIIDAARSAGPVSSGDGERLNGPGCPYCGGEGCVQVGSPEAWTWEPCDKCGGDIAPTPPSPTGEVGGVAEGWVLVPTDDASRSFSDSTLPAEMIDAGVAVMDQVHHENMNYVAGVTTDWDDGMVAVAIYRAMIAAAPPSREA